MAILGKQNKISRLSAALALGIFESYTGEIRLLPDHGPAVKAARGIALSGYGEAEKTAILCRGVLAGKYVLRKVYGDSMEERIADCVIRRAMQRSGMSVYGMKLSLNSEALNEWRAGFETEFSLLTGMFVRNPASPGFRAGIGEYILRAAECATRHVMETRQAGKKEKSGKNFAENTVFQR